MPSHDDNKLTPNQIKNLTNSGYFENRIRAAKHPKTELSDVKRLLDDHDSRVRFAVMQFTHYKGIINSIANDCDNFSTSTSMLSWNTIQQHLYYLAANTHITESAAITIAHYGGQRVKHRLAKNTAITASILRILFENNNDIIRELVVANPNCPDEIKFIYEMEK